MSQASDGAQTPGSARPCRGDSPGPEGLLVEDILGQEAHRMGTDTGSSWHLQLLSVRERLLVSEEGTQGQGKCAVMLAGCILQLPAI